MKWIHEIKSSHGCFMCGETHPFTLQFHHRDPSNKLERVSKMIGRKAKRDEIIKEIEKCDVVCANCHIKIHHKSLD